MKANAFEPGPWPVTSWLACARAQPPAIRPACRKAAVRKTAALVGDHERGARGSDGSTVVLADRDWLQKSTGDVWPVTPPR
jgi:hypothetical protein